MRHHPRNNSARQRAEILSMDADELAELQRRERMQSVAIKAMYRNGKRRKLNITPRQKVKVMN